MAASFQPGLVISMSAMFRGGTRGRRLLNGATLLGTSFLALGLQGCTVLSVAGTVTSTAVSVASTVVTTGVSVTGKVVEKAVDVAIGDEPEKAAQP